MAVELDLDRPAARLRSPPCRSCRASTRAGRRLMLRDVLAAWAPRPSRSPTSARGRSARSVVARCRRRRRRTPRRRRRRRARRASRRGAGTSEAAHRGGRIDIPACRSPRSPPATTTCCSTSTAASGSATSHAARRGGGRRAARGRQGHRVRDQRRAATRPRTSSASSGGWASGPRSRRSSPSAARCSTCSPSATPARPRTSSARRPCTATSPTPACGSSTGRRSPSRAEVVVVAGHERLRLRRAARSRPRRCCAARRSSAPARDRTFPMPDGPWPGTGRGPRRGRGGDRARPPRPSASPSRSCSAPRSTGSGRPGARWSSATGSTPTSAGARAAGLDGALVLTGATSARRGRRRREARAAAGGGRGDARPTSCCGPRLLVSLAGARGSASSSTPTPAAAARPSALPGVEAALRGHGVAVRVERTLSLEHASELRARRRPAGEVAVSYGGDGLAGAVAHALRGDRRRARRAARRARQRLRPQARHPAATRRRRARCSPTARERTVDVGRGRRPHVPRHRELRLRLRRSRTSRTRRRPSSGQLVYLYATLRALAAWKPVRLRVRRRRRPERDVPGYASPRATRASSAAAWRSRPTPTSRTACSTSC